MKRFLALLVSSLLFGLMEVAAQTPVVVTLADNSSQQYTIDYTGGLYFDAGTLFVKSTASADAETVGTFESISKIVFPSNTDVDVVAEDSHSPVIYPNPASTHFFVRGIGDENSVMTIYSVVGQRMMEVSCSDGSAVDVSSLPRGLYVVSVANKNMLLSIR